MGGAYSSFHFCVYLHGVVRFDKSIQLFLQFIQRQPKCSSEGRRKKLFQKITVELLAKIIVGLGRLVDSQMLDVRRGKKSLKGVHRRKAAIFARFSSMNRS